MLESLFHLFKIEMEISLMVRNGDDTTNVWHKTKNPQSH